MLVGQRRAEDLVVDPEILQADARFRDARRAAGLEHEDRFARQAVRYRRACYDRVGRLTASAESKQHPKSNIRHPFL